MNNSSSRRPGGPDLPGATWGLPRELDELIDRLGRWTGWDFGRPGASRWMPVAEEDETADAYRVRLELPGIPRDQVSVEVEGRELCVRGDLAEAGTQQSTYLSHRSGSFVYRTSLPGDADGEAIRADLSDGVLTVTVPRSGPAGRRSVPIGTMAPASGEVIVGETAESAKSSKGGSGEARDVWAAETDDPDVRRDTGTTGTTDTTDTSGTTDTTDTSGTTGGG